jgi:hypothetical protein
MSLYDDNPYGKNVDLMGNMIEKGNIVVFSFEGRMWRGFVDHVFSDSVSIRFPMEDSKMMLFTRYFSQVVVLDAPAAPKGE